MLTPFTKILEKYRRESFSEADKGTRFEELMREYLWSDPKYAMFFKDIWLWHDFPFRKDFGSGHDVGIDLVAQTHDGAQIVATAIVHGLSVVTRNVRDLDFADVKIVNPWEDK